MFHRLLIEYRFNKLRKKIKLKEDFMLNLENQSMSIYQYLTKILRDISVKEKELEYKKESINNTKYDDNNYKKELICLYSNTANKSIQFLKQTYSNLQVSFEKVNKEISRINNELILEKTNIDLEYGRYLRLFKNNNKYKLNITISETYKDFYFENKEIIK